MFVRANQAYTAMSSLPAWQKTENAPEETASSAQSGSAPGTQVSISAAARALAQTPADDSNAAASSTVVSLDTGHGTQLTNLDQYFTYSGDGAAALPALLPTQQNISAISDHAAERVKTVLGEEKIPTAPASIRYDQDGKMMVPPDYPHKERLDQTMNKHQGLNTELRTLTSLSGQYAESQKLQPYFDAVSQARSKADLEAANQRHQSLLWSTSNYPSQISLNFSKGGQLSVMADGKALATSAS